MVSSFVSPQNGSHSVAADLADKLAPVTSQILRVSAQRSGLLRSLDMLATTTLRRRSYDVAIVGLYSGRAFLWGEAVSSLLARLACPFVLSLHGGRLPEFSATQAQRVRACLQKATVVTAPSAYLREQMRAYHDDIQIVPNPLEIARYDFRLRSQPQPRVLWLRAFHEIYHPALAATVTAELARQFPDIQLIMVGPDKGDGSQQHVMQLARELGVSDRLALPGGIANHEVPQWLQRGDIFLNTTNVDNTPVSVLEAMACGLCVVSTNVGGLPYLLTHEHDALLVPPNDPAAMTQAVRRLLTEPELAARLSANARRKAESFAWENVLPQWQRLLTDLTTQRR